jgi:lipid A ethanolaminephosphotransferase
MHFHGKKVFVLPAQQRLAMFRVIHSAIPRLQVSATVINLIAAAFLVCCANGPFWTAFTTKIGLATAGHMAFLVMAGLSLCMVFNILFSFFSFRPVHKPFLTAVFCTAAIVSYFMGSYGIVVNQHIIIDLLGTDVRKASEELTWPLFRHFLLLGVLPSTLLLVNQVTYRPWRRELLVRSGVILGSAVLLVAMVLADFKEFILFGRSNIELRMYINPTYPIYSLIKTVKKNRQGNRSEPLKVVAPDAKRPANTPRTAVVLVVGESARAEQFSLNGYPRATNPQLSSRDVFSFTDVQSCGTGTAESLPCMFSHLGRSQYSRYEAKRYENLLDILQRTGVQVVWRDNNTGSKGVADRIRYEDLANEGDPALCSSDGCYDEILLRDLGKMLSSNAGEMLIVIHQKGSHGPSYYKRSPKNFKQFLPECSQADVPHCDQQSIINAYDNTIVYTDYVLGKLIDLLKAQNYATAMLYISDHGESLGENNIYLHGFPYAIAPRQQTHVPMIFWASSSYLREKAVDQGLLRKYQTDRISHDYLFHSLLGMFSVTTAVYRPELDLFQSVLRPEQ